MCDDSSAGASGDGTGQSSYQADGPNQAPLRRLSGAVTTVETELERKPGMLKSSVEEVPK